MLCDGCDKAYHTVCVGLKEVPAGDWFCSKCGGGGETETTTTHAVAIVANGKDHSTSTTNTATTTTTNDAPPLEDDTTNGTRHHHHHRRKNSRKKNKKSAKKKKIVKKIIMSCEGREKTLLESFRIMMRETEKVQKQMNFFQTQLLQDNGSAVLKSEIR